MLDKIEKYKKLFGIKIAVTDFPAKELKRRWQILVKKYHPDNPDGFGDAAKFRFVQEAYKYLKQYCDIGINNEKEKIENIFESEIEEIKVRTENGFIYLWNIGEADFRKQYHHQKNNPHLYKGQNLKVKI